jgi:hypothetical protein
MLVSFQRLLRLMYSLNVKEEIFWYCYVQQYIFWSTVVHYDKSTDEGKVRKVLKTNESKQGHLFG